MTYRLCKVMNKERHKIQKLQPAIEFLGLTLRKERWVQANYAMDIDNSRRPIVCKYKEDAEKKIKEWEEDEIVENVAWI